LGDISGQSARFEDGQSLLDGELEVKAERAYLSSMAVVLLEMECDE
jgi:hypothetical protein